MKDEGNNLYSVFDEIIPRAEKGRFLKQRSRSIWMTGLSGSGKTTLAKYLERKLMLSGYLSTILDGDNVRTGINEGLGFSETDRAENIRRIAEVNRLFLDCGIVCINCFVSPTAEVRAQAKNIIGADDFVEVYINTPLEACEQRDVKGLYARARKGEIADFTGVSAPFEAPVRAAIEIRTAGRSVEECGDELLGKVLTFIEFN